MRPSTQAGAGRLAGPCFVLALLLSLYVLFAPVQGGPTGPPGSDKAVHLALFALLAATTRWRFGPSPGLAVAVAAYAVASEVVQAVLLPERSGDPLDLLADLLGIALGWLLAGRRLTDPPR